MILPSCSFLLWSVFFFPLFPPDAMPEHSELIDGDPGLGVYWESKNSFIRNYARLIGGPVQFVYPARSSLEAEQAA